jgi:hypothetical protein
MNRKRNRSFITKTRKSERAAQALAPREREKTMKNIVFFRYSMSGVPACPD